MSIDNENDHISNNHGITWQVLAHVAGGILLAIGGYFGAGLITKVQALEIQAAVTENRYDNIISQLMIMDERLIRIEQSVDLQTRRLSPPPPPMSHPGRSTNSSNHGFPTTRSLQ